jgi:hypothetical protein
MLNSVKWNSPVICQMRQASPELLAITNTREAAHCLMADWPDCRGEAYYKAIRTCGLVLCGFLKPEISRSSFIDAAYESSVLMLC